ncbi:sigma 54-interacting transcriptional regulator [Acetonema longum]|uniref:PAS sensor protein n=1 Tax=Acetonema longum DSM 6540 TaxID=1009370 RepID=F7NNJ0_9FIRM|nr:sigma 54-interacting transcriptional regulator [Acetonema longum]EGO62431.1 PAS sensor protein [Acetonema longum DSM 6540]
MSGIVFIAPNAEIGRIAENLKVDPDEYNVIYARLEEGVKAAGRALQKGARVLISRGFTCHLIEEAFPDASVIDVRYTAFDLLRAYLQAATCSQSIAIVDIQPVIDGMNSVEAILNLNVGTKTVKLVIPDYHSYMDGIDQAVAKGYDCVIGNQAIVNAAAARGLTGVLLRSGREGIELAVAAARQILAIHRIRDANALQTEIIINSVDYGIIAIDSDGSLIAFNRQARYLLRLDISNSRLDAFLVVMRKLMLEQEKVIGRVEKVDGHGEVVVNYLPIIVDGEPTGMVATIQALQQLQDIEQKTREELARRGRVARYSFADIESKSPVMRRVIQDAKRFAAYDATVLILGETGVGKEYFAHAIHQASPRQRGPFVVVNCAAIPENILESELFGYVEGAFTGAKKGGKVGLFEQAHKGTIFLDEIGEISENLQVRLLRVLQEHEVYRLGDDRIMPVDIRVIAATNRDLSALVHEKKFREDLYYRLDVLTLEIPPIRERKEDLEQLIHHFILEYNEKYHSHVESIEPGGLEILLNHDWPGNIRELHNFLGRVTALTQGKVIQEKEVLHCLRRRYQPQREGAAGLKEIEKTAILEALRKSGGSKQMAADMLGIGRATLWRRLKELADPIE